jgi:hypothetical protein
MYKLPFIYTVMTFVSLSSACQEKSAPQKEVKKSNFKVLENYTEFASKMENGDTMNIDVNLSICLWDEYDKLCITKSHDSLYIQVKEKRMMDEAPFYFEKVPYKLKNDSMDLQKMFLDFDTTNPERMTGSFFCISNPKEKDTIKLKPINMIDRMLRTERYKSILIKIYPDKYKDVYDVIPTRIY